MNHRSASNESSSPNSPRIINAEKAEMCRIVHASARKQMERRATANWVFEIFIVRGRKLPSWSIFRNSIGITREKKFSSFETSQQRSRLPKMTVFLERLEDFMLTRVIERLQTRRLIDLMGNDSINVEFTALMTLRSEFILKT